MYTFAQELKLQTWKMIEVLESLQQIKEHTNGDYDWQSHSSIISVMKHLLLLERTITDEAIQNNCSNKSD